MPGRLKATVYVQDPSTREELILLPGECPDPEVAALVTNPDAWEVPSKGYGPESISVGEPNATAEKMADPEPEEAGRGGAKKPPPRRSRSAPASS